MQLWVQVEAYLSKLDPIVAALQVTHPAASYDRRSLGQLFGQLEQLMEDALGVKARLYAPRSANPSAGCRPVWVL